METETYAEESMYAQNKRMKETFFLRKRKKIVFYCNKFILCEKLK